MKKFKKSVKLSADKEQVIKSQLNFNGANYELHPIIHMTMPNEWEQGSLVEAPIGFDMNKIADLPQTYIKELRDKIPRADGHEIGNYSYSHSNKLKRNTDQKPWNAEIEECNFFLTVPYNPNDPKNLSHGIGLEKQTIYGIRAPFLSYPADTWITF